MDNKLTERTPHKCSRCGYEDNLIAKCLKPPKDADKQKKQVCFSERGNRASQKECNKGKNNSDQKIYASMARMSENDECPSMDFVDSSQ